MRLSQLTVQPTAQRTRRPPAAMDPGRLAPPRLSAAARPKAREPPPLLGRGGAGGVLWRLPGRCSPTCRHGPAAGAVIDGGGSGPGGGGGGGAPEVRSRGPPGSFGSASAVPRLACGRAFEFTKAAVMTSLRKLRLCVAVGGFARAERSGRVTACPSHFLSESLPVRVTACPSHCLSESLPALGPRQTGQGL